MRSALFVELLGPVLPSFCNWPEFVPFRRHRRRLHRRRDDVCSEQQVDASQRSQLDCELCTFREGGGHNTLALETCCLAGVSEADERLGQTTNCISVCLPVPSRAV